MRCKSSNTIRRPNAKQADDDIDIIFGSIHTHIKAFAQFADTQFDLGWYQRQPPMARATICLMADEIVETARTTMADTERSFLAGKVDWWTNKDDKSIDVRR